MSYLKRLSPSTFKAVKNVGKVLDLQQIILAPKNAQPEDLIEIFSKVDGENKKVDTINSIFLHTLRKMYPFKKQGKTQPSISSKESADNSYNPFITHIQSDEIEAALIYDKGVDSSTDWTSEEMELLQLISQIVKADLLFKSDNSAGFKVKKIAEQKKISYQILELQYALPMANSLLILKIAKQRLESLDFCDGLEEFKEMQSYLDRSLRLLSSAKEAVDEIQKNYWSQTTGAEKSFVDKIRVDEFFSIFCNEYNSAEADIYYGHVQPILSPQRQNIYIRTVILEKFLNAVFNNAVKFSKEDKAEIYVTSELDDLDLIVTVRDMGIGIPDEEVQYIGDPFFKASNNETEKGLGVELSIIERMIEDYGGSLNFESVENVYTEVVCNLPYLVDGLQDNE